MTVLKTKRLRVRRLVPDDAEALYTNTQEDLFRQELPEEVLLSTKHALAKIQFYQGRYMEKALPLVYGLELGESGLLIGHIALCQNPQGVQIRCAIAAPHRGKGYAREVVRPFSIWAKKYLGLDYLYGLSKSSDTAYCTILERSGYRFLWEETRNFWGEEFAFRFYAI